MTDPLRRLTASELNGHAARGNGFGRLEDARAVAKAHPGAEVIAKEGEQFVLYAKPDDLARIKQPVDFLGVNYYSRMHQQPDPQGLFGTNEIWDILPKWIPRKRRGIR